MIFNYDNIDEDDFFPEDLSENHGDGEEAINIFVLDEEDEIFTD